MERLGFIHEATYFYDRFLWRTRVWKQEAAGAADGQLLTSFYLLIHDMPKPFEDLSRIHLRLALASTVVYHVHGEALGAVADTIVGYVSGTLWPRRVDSVRCAGRVAGWLTREVRKRSNPKNAWVIRLPRSIAMTYNIAASVIYRLYESPVRSHRAVRPVSGRALAANRVAGSLSIGTGTGYELYLHR